MASGALASGRELSVAMPSALEQQSTTSPIPGWTVDASRLVASTKWHKSWLAFFVFAALWNFGMIRFWTASSKPVVPALAAVGYVAAMVFTLLAVRAQASRTIIRFDARALTITAALAPWSKYRVDLAEIERFETALHADAGHTDLVVRLRSGGADALPIDWQPVPIGLRGQEKRFFVAKASDAAWLAAALNDMLTAARQLGHDTYRS